MARASRRSRPVLVLPGLGGGDRSTIAIRSHLAALGHPVEGWGLGRNEGVSEKLLGELSSLVIERSDRYGTRLALVGWSLGGALAAGLARRHPDRVLLVVTMGSPLSRVESLDRLDGIPVTSIWSRHDRVVPWRSSMVEPGPMRENVEVRSLHLTLGFDPTVHHVVADRLRQPIPGWRPFRSPSWARSAYPTEPAT